MFLLVYSVKIFMALKLKFGFSIFIFISQSFEPACLFNPFGGANPYKMAKLRVFVFGDWRFFVVYVPFVRVWRARVNEITF